jgi:hypothetical protein
MSKAKLLQEIELYVKGSISYETLSTAVDDYSSALLRQTDVTRSLPPLLQKCSDCGKEDDSVKIREDGYGLQCYKCYKSDKDFEEDYD